MVVFGFGRFAPDAFERLRSQSVVRPTLPHCAERKDDRSIVSIKFIVDTFTPRRHIQWLFPQAVVAGKAIQMSSRPMSLLPVPRRAFPLHRWRWPTRSTRISPGDGLKNTRRPSGCGSQRRWSPGARPVPGFCARHHHRGVAHITRPACGDSPAPYSRSGGLPSGRAIDLCPEAGCDSALLQ